MFDEDLLEFMPIKVIDGFQYFSVADQYVDNYNKIAKKHLEHFTSEEPNPFMQGDLVNSLNGETQTLIREFSEDGDFILDAGVGIGTLLEPFTNLTRYGVDVATPYLEHCRSKGINCAMSKIEDMPFKENTFDLVTCTDVFEHVFDLNSCIRKIEHVLKPGGYLIMRVPNDECLDPYLEMEEFEFVHLRSFSEGSVQLLFEKVFPFELVCKQGSVCHMQSSDRFLFNPLSNSNFVEIKEVLNTWSLLAQDRAFMNSIVMLDQEQFINGIYYIKEAYPQAFSLIEKSLVKPIEMNYVFRLV